MYIAGLDIHHCLRNSPLSHNQGVEGIVWLTTLAAVARAARRHAKGAHHPNTRHAQRDNALSKTGIPAPPGSNIGQQDTPATPLLVKILSPIAHGVIIVTPIVYLVGTAWSRLEQPEWFANWALPNIDALGFGQFATLRTAACVLNYGALHLWKRASYEQRRATLGPETTIPQSGPYSVVRHPMSSVILLGQATYALMWWNTIPLAGLGLTALYLAASLPHEEALNEADAITGAQYSAYKKRVTSKVIPYIW